MIFMGGIYIDFDEHIIEYLKQKFLSMLNKNREIIGFVDWFK